MSTETPCAVNFKKVDDIIASIGAKKQNLIAILQKVQEEFRFLPQEESISETCGLRLDSCSRTAFFDGKPFSLTASEFNILWFLMNNPNKYFSADEIYEKVWSAPSLQTTTIRRHLSTLRQKLKELSPEKNLVRTEFGNGYAFCPSGDKL